jgi:enamine deaminase RidA (YjgF/YER057c/UK114 family)
MTDLDAVVSAAADGRADHYLTAAAPRGRSALKFARTVYAQVAAALAARRLEPVQEKIYGLARAKAAILATRASAFEAHGLDASLPVTYVEGSPAAGGACAGVQVWAVRRGPRGRPRIAAVRHPWGLGRLWAERGTRFLYLPAVPGAAPDGALPGSRGEQARRMFWNARTALRAQGFEFAHVVRTWIYLRRILDWYGEFNRVRNALYRRPDFFGASWHTCVPASTGIEGSCGRGDCVMDVLAVRPGGRRRIRVRTVARTSRQGAAPAYGSAFARAVALRRGTRQTIHVSGTASIDAAGNSVGVGDPEQQGRQTLLNVAALLAERGAGLEDIRTAVLFCKDRKSHEAFLRARRRMRVPAFPTIAFLADICRPELSIELEAVAAV